MKKSKKQKNQKRKGKKKVINELASFGFLPSAPIHTWDWKGNESRLKERNFSKTKGLFDNIFKINFWEQFLKNNSKLFWMKKFYLFQSILCESTMLLCTMQKFPTILHVFNCFS